MFLKLDGKNSFLNLSIAREIYANRNEIHIIFGGTPFIREVLLLDSEKVANETLTNMMVAFNNGQIVYCLK